MVQIQPTLDTWKWPYPENLPENLVIKGKKPVITSIKITPGANRKAAHDDDSPRAEKQA